MGALEEEEEETKWGDGEDERGQSVGGEARRASISLNVTAEGWEPPRCPHWAR